MHGAIGRMKNEEKLREFAYALGRHPQFQSEIKIGSDLGWHVLMCAPNQESTAQVHLTARRFGAYLPQIERPDKKREHMFPGYIFVFLWDIAHHWPRLRMVPGILGVLAPISDTEINRIQAIENERCPVFAETADDVIHKRRKKRWRKTRLPDELKVNQDIHTVVAVRSWSAFQDVDMAALDSDERNSLLRRAIGLV